MDQFSYLSAADPGFIDGMYQSYLTDRNSVDESWRFFLDGFEFATTQYGKKLKPSALSGGGEVSVGQLSKEISVLNLIGAYRQRGHLYANVNPVLPQREPEFGLDHKNFGLTDADLEQVFEAGKQLGMGAAKLKDIIALLEKTYCGTIGVEFRYMRNPQMVDWLQSRMEKTRNVPKFSKEEKEQIATLLHRASAFEEYLQRRTPGQKRFSLEGGEALIPGLNALILRAAEIGVQECVIGMAHRGRLNVLTNILRKEYDWVFAEFFGKGLSDEKYSGDVKYHMGYSNDRSMNGHKVHLSLCPNPSHLDAVNPVVAGQARAKMDRKYNGDNNKICPILIHGDASLAGQGIGYEVIQMSRLKGYEVGGTLHMVINNQVGFTTDPRDSRSSAYCTDVAKVTLSPVFHVNGDDIESVVLTAQMAMEFRQEFKRDVFVDIICYRKYGHNEGDEPRFTQPILYANIKNHPSPYEVYKKKLLAEGEITADFFEKLENAFKNKLDDEWDQSKVNDYDLNRPPTSQWTGIEFYDDYVLEANPDTRISTEKVKELTKAITSIPETFAAHPTVAKLIQQRGEMVNTLNKLDWGAAEHLAFASLMDAGYPVRITGQDVERGTFSHRHAVIHDQKTDELFTPLNHLHTNQAPIYIHNSLLSEYAVMGFELGYSMADPNALTIWEAQYGDFVNGAQIIIDQFLSSAKNKWRRMIGLVLLLPHGYEGGGPEHSSARPERFLTLCAENNMYVCNFTTPANYFHALRRQVLSKTRRPLVVFSPKSLLRHPECVSTVEDLSNGRFVEVFDDAQANAKKVKRVVFTFGKLYYDLLKKRNEQGIDDIALVRIEQLYPFPDQQLAEICNKYSKAKEFVWAQEEPENMGGWSFFLRKFKHRPVTVVARKESASPAVGATSMSNAEQENLVLQALNLVKEPVLV